MPSRGRGEVVQQGGFSEPQVHLYAGGVATAGMSALRTGPIFPARPLLLPPHPSTRERTHALEK